MVGIARRGKVSPRGRKKKKEKRKKEKEGEGGVIMRHGPYPSAIPTSGPSLSISWTYFYCIFPSSSG